MAEKRDGRLNISGVLQMLDELSSDYDDSDRDPDFKTNENDDESSSEDSDIEPRHTPKKKRPAVKKQGDAPKGLKPVVNKTVHRDEAGAAAQGQNERSVPVLGHNAVQSNAAQDNHANLFAIDPDTPTLEANDEIHAVVPDPEIAPPNENQQIPDRGQPAEALGHGDGDGTQGAEGPNEEVMDRGTRRRKSDPAAWKRTVRKTSRAKGLQYTDAKGRERAERHPKDVNCQRCRFKCDENFTPEMREALCKEYWALGDFNRQKDFLLTRTKLYNVQRVRLVGERRRKRERTVVYSFVVDAKEIRVCKNFFLKTLAISHSVVERTQGNRGDGGTFTGEDKRGKHTPGNKIDDERVAAVKRHIESFPTVESHYTRKDTKRLYLNQNLSIRKMYRLYTEKCEAADPPIPPVKEGKYREIFCENYNLSFYKPKKDQCATCAKYKKLRGDQQEAMREEYEAHVRRKEEANAVKAADKARATAEEEFVTASFDLQSVLQIPSSDVSIMYYCRKLCVYNLCIYQAAPPKNGFCYCWSEVEGGRGSNEIGTCLYKWLAKLQPTIKEVSLFSDTCGGQNRNQNVAAMFLYAVQKLPLEVITHNFLESGHSMMQCDTMHAAIECEKKYRDIYTMIDWIGIFRRARRQNPFSVTNFHHGDIYNFQQLAQQTVKNRRKDEDGNTINWLLVKSFRYQKDEPGIIFYKYNHGEDYRRIRAFGRGRPLLPEQLPKAYTSRIPISTAKKNDLLKMCRLLVIPEELHQWFEGLPTSHQARDRLPEPAVEDSADELDDDPDSVA